jgi:hypothetical protein
LPQEKPCNHIEHEPPTQIYLEKGVYEHECPGCGQVFTFVVPGGPRWFVDELPGRRGKMMNVIVTPTGSAWIVTSDLAMAKWAVDILNAGEIK